jgi:hypothetical protein
MAKGKGDDYPGAKTGLPPLLESRLEHAHRGVQEYLYPVGTEGERFARDK